MIIARLSGGLGNQMFQYALGRSLSIRYGAPLKLDTTFLLQRVKFFKVLRPNFVFRNYDLDVFNVAATTAEAGDMKWWQRPILFGKAMLVIDALLRKIPFLPGWERTFSFDSRIFSIGPNAYLSGFWQSPKYFDSIRDVLLKDFSLKHPLPEHSMLLKKEMEQKESVCMFVRRSDIAAKQFHGSLNREYYVKGLAYLKERVVIDKVYIFSDDIEWCKEHLSLPFETMFVDNAYAGKKWEDHMELMKHCKHFVISNSTFAWWGAWLATNAKKIVIAPKKWANNATINTNDLIPEEWIRL